MQGLSPRSPGLTSQQIQTSKQLCEAMPDLPTALSDLISEMAVPDYASAMLPLQLDEDNQVIQSQQNLYIIACIKSALTSPSTECDPLIKASIFCNAKGKSDHNSIHPYLSHILHDLHDLANQARQINLDDVVLDNLDFSSNGVRLDLSGMSAKRATFSHVNMKNAKLDSADLTGAKFNDVCLQAATMINADVTDAIFWELTLMHTEVNQLVGNQSAIFDSLLTNTEYTIADGMATGRTDIVYLNGMYFTAVPNRSQFILPAK